MASWIESFSPSFAGGTDTTVPLVLSRDVQVDRIELQFPSGSNGKLAVQILQANQQVIPPVTGQVITASDAKFDWPVENFIVAQHWSIRGINTGTFAHQVYLRFHCSEPAPIVSTSPLSFGTSSRPINPLAL